MKEDVGKPVVEIQLPLPLLPSAGNIEDGIGHLINFVQFSGNPRATLVTLQQTLPPPIFNLLARTYAALMQMKVWHAKTIPSIRCHMHSVPSNFFNQQMNLIMTVNLNEPCN